MNDLKYGIGELLINIEMFIFSILHIWAFSWKPYEIASSGSEVTDFYGAGKGSYEGGKWGMKALVDAMNPLDLFKAVGRSARWLAVGRKHRTDDISYQRQSDAIGLQSPDGSLGTQGTAYHGASAAMSGGRYGVAPDEEDAVLLQNAQSNPETSHLGTTPYGEDSDGFDGGGGRYYQQQHNEPSFYDPAPPHLPPLEPHGALEMPYSQNPYPDDAPLREQVPMPIPEPTMTIPDPYQPPPPYPENLHHP